MREIQELTIQAANEATRIDTAIKEHSEKFRSEPWDWLGSVHQSAETPWGGGVHFAAIPISPLDLDRVAGRPRLQDFSPSVFAHFGARKIECVMPHANMINWRPGLRCISACHPNRVQAICELAKSEPIFGRWDFVPSAKSFRTTDNTAGVYRHLPENRARFARWASSLVP
jgi:hypothetical protein